MSFENQDHAKKSQESSRYLCFSLGTEEYALPLLTVKEVIGVPEVRPLPHTPPYFLGLMNLRGQVIPVLDLRQKFNIKPKDNKETAVIICSIGEQNIGVVVDSINSVLAPDSSELIAAPQIHSSISTDYILGVYRKDSRLVLMMDIGRVLNPADHKLVKSQAKQAA